MKLISRLNYYYNNKTKWYYKWKYQTRYNINSEQMGTYFGLYAATIETEFPTVFKELNDSHGKTTILSH